MHRSTPSKLFCQCKKTPPEEGRKAKGSDLLSPSSFSESAIGSDSDQNGPLNVTPPVINPICSPNWFTQIPSPNTPSGLTQSILSQVPTSEPGLGLSSTDSLGVQGTSDKSATSVDSKGTAEMSLTLMHTPPGQTTSSSFMCSQLDLAGEPYDLFGDPMPVLVVEGLYSRERGTEVSVKLEPNGFAILVCGRKLYIWKYQDEGSFDLPSCHQLPLPPSDLSHRADLVYAWGGCIAVSPEGHVRFWHNMHHDGACVDVQPDLQGQECFILFPLTDPIKLGFFGCLLATTSGTLIVITPTTGEGKYGVVCRTLTIPISLFTGLGRRFNSFIFGPTPSESRVLSRVLGDQDIIYVLNSSNSLQKWRIEMPPLHDQFLFEADLDRDLKNQFFNQLLAKSSRDVLKLRTWCLDMQVCPSGVVILAAGTLVPQFGGKVTFAFGFVDSHKVSEKFSRFLLTSFTVDFKEDMDEKLLQYRLILPTPDSPCAYVYNEDQIVTFTISSDSPVKHSILDLRSKGNGLWGAGTYEGWPLFFMKEYGIVSYVNHPVPVVKRELEKETPRVVNTCEQLQASLLAFCAKNLEDSEFLVHELDGPLDKPVLELSLNIIDECSANDPRWCKALPKSFVSSALIIGYQLSDKLKSHELLVKFFLTMIQLNERAEDGKTRTILSEHGEKLAAASYLFNSLNDHRDILEPVICACVGMASNSSGIQGQLTAADLFFRKVSDFHLLFMPLVQYVEANINIDIVPAEIKLKAVMTVNKIILGIMNVVFQYREKHPELQNKDYPPWTSTDDKPRIGRFIRELVILNKDHGQKLSDKIDVLQLLNQQYAELVDVYIQSGGEDGPSYLQPMLSRGQYESAAILSEKYMFLEMLVQICEESKDADRLQKYIDQFAEQNFANVVFQWYCDKGMWGRLFTLKLKERDALGTFLQNHPDLCWIYLMQEKKYAEAFQCLWRLALNEEAFCYRKKTLLSLTKACLIMSDISLDAKSIVFKALERENMIITHQEALPICVLEAYGLDPKTMRVLSPQELIEMFTSEENLTACYVDFKMALELLTLIDKAADDPEIVELRQGIWAKTILRDSWELKDENNPLENFKESTVFELIQFAMAQGVIMSNFLIPIDVLLEHKNLSALDSCARYQLRAGFEEVLKSVQEANE